MLTRSKYLLAKMESTYATDPTPAAANAIITNALSRTIYGGPRIERETDRAALGARAQVNASPMVGISFNAEIMGSGTLGTPPNIGAVLRACGFDETISASTSVAYAPVSSGYESIACYYDRGAERQIALGVRGTGGLTMNAGSFPLFNFELTGLYAKPANVTMVTPAPTPNIEPVPVNNTNTPDCTIGSYDVIMTALTIDFGNTVPHQDFVNNDTVDITDRVMTGQITFLAPHIGTKDIFALVQSHAGATTDTFQLIHGATPNIFQLDAPAIQLTDIQEVDINGTQGYQCPFRLLPSSGDDELTMTWK